MASAANPRARRPAAEGSSEPSREPARTDATVASGAMGFNGFRLASGHFAKCRCISPANSGMRLHAGKAPGRRWPCLAAAPVRRICARRSVSRSAGVPSGHAA